MDSFVSFGRTPTAHPFCVRRPYVPGRADCSLMVRVGCRYLFPCWGHAQDRAVGASAVGRDERLLRELSATLAAS